MMSKINHMVGGILFVSGTAIGAAMLALPVSTALMGFYPSLILFAFCWLSMLATGFFFLDVSLSVRGEPNLISMAGRTLGPWGKAFSWIFYLLLLYSLIAAFLSGSAPLFSDAIFAVTGVAISTKITIFILPACFALLVYFGMESSDFINRLLMLGLAITFFFLVASTPEHVEMKRLTHMDWKFFILGLPIAVTAFGYHVIIPSLSTYMNHNRKKLQLVIIIGSLLTLIFYLIWQFLIIGSVPLTGEHGMIAAFKAGESSVVPLSYVIQKPWLSQLARAFSFFAITTTFLGMSISLKDFLGDGLKLKSNKKGKLLALILAFIPPLIFALFYQRGFVVALEYAGGFVVLLLWFLPAVMAWKLKTPKFYQSFLGRTLIIFIILGAFAILLIDILHQSGFLHSLVAKYVSP